MSTSGRGPRTARGRGARWLLASASLSGIAALIFEAVWFHRTNLVFGSEVWSTSLVLSSFMGGLTLGSAAVSRYAPRIRQLLTSYAAAELIVAGSGVGLTLVLPTLTQGVVSVTTLAQGHVWSANAVRWIIAFVLLLIPSTAMGATLPLLVSGVSQFGGHFGSALGRAYGWNTLGAMIGVAAADLWLIAEFGISGAAWCAAGCSAAAAAIALLLHRTAKIPIPTVSGIPSEGLPPEGSPPAPRTIAARPAAFLLLGASFVSGLALLALEVVWFRFLTLFVLSTTTATALMLAVVLAGIAVGGLVAAAWIARDADASRHLPAVAVLTAMAVAGAYATFHLTTTGAQIAHASRILWLATALALPASLLSGVLFTLLGQLLRRTETREIRTAGWLTLANTAGGMVGPLLAAFILLPRLGTERSIILLSIAYLVVAAFAAGALEQRWRVGATLTLAAASLLLLVSAGHDPLGVMARQHLPRVIAPYSTDGAAVVQTREGPSETIMLMQRTWLGEPVYTRLVTNGFSMSGTSIAALRYMRFFVYWPMLLHHGPISRVLVICYGVGVTAGAALHIPDVTRVDVAEISPDVAALSPAIHPTDDPLGDPRVRLHLEDGRRFLASTHDRYDLITGEPPPPRTPGAANIYTREYFDLVRSRLAPGGIATYWLPVARPDPGTNVNAIIGAFCDAFTDCSLWNATPFDFMLVGTRGAPPVSEDEFVRPWTIPTLRARLEEIGFELPQQVGATFLGDHTYLRQVTSGTLPLDDSHPQRLRPRAGTPSWSDPGYGSDPAVTHLYDTATDTGRARDAFLASSFIRTLWPPRIRDASVPFFEQQQLLNEVMFRGGGPLPRIKALHGLLQNSPLTTLPLWLLGSDHVREAIALRHDDGSSEVMYARALTALARRDFINAERSLAEAERRGVGNATATPLRAYALARLGRLDAARQLAGAVPASSHGERSFWNWMSEQFAVTPSSPR